MVKREPVTALSLFEYDAVCAPASWLRMSGTLEAIATALRYD